jgi:hypothetical protein
LTNAEQNRVIAAIEEIQRGAQRTRPARAA